VLVDVHGDPTHLPSGGARIPRTPRVPPAGGSAEGSILCHPRRRKEAPGAVGDAGVA
jgi:hypothetical protein